MCITIRVTYIPMRIDVRRYVTSLMANQLYNLYNLKLQKLYKTNLKNLYLYLYPTSFYTL